MPNPYIANKLQAWTFDPQAAQSTFTPGAGVLNLARIDIGQDQAVYASNICVIVTTGGTGTTALANCYVGLYSSAGALLANSGSADQSSGGSNWSTSGGKVVAMTAAQLLQPGSSYYVGLVVGTQATTNVVFQRGGSAAAANIGLTASTARNGTILSGLTALPASFTPGSVSLAATFWAGLS